MIAQETLDEFAIIARRGAENAGSMLSRWLRRAVHIDVSSVELVRLDLIPGSADADSNAATVTLAARVRGGLPGNIAVQLPFADAAALVQCLGGRLELTRQAGAIGEMERSMLQETANILFSSVMNSLALHLGLDAIPYAPAVLVDVGTAAWDSLLIEAAETAEQADEAVVIIALLACIDGGPRLRLVFLPAPQALDVISRGVADASP